MKLAAPSVCLSFALVLSSGLLLPAEGRAEGEVPAVDFVPADFAAAIGAGWYFPSDVLTISRVSAKFRTPDISIEPFIALGIDSGETKSELTGTGGTDTTNTTGGNVFGLGATMYYPLMAQHNVELQALGSVRLQRSASENDPDGDNNVTTASSLTFGMGYGIAIEWWLSQRISIMGTATNELASISSTSSEQEIGTEKSTQSSSNKSFGLIWSPSIGAIFNLWF